MKNADRSNSTETNIPSSQDASTGCCGGAAPKDSGACCALDAEVKEAGGSGCGCGPKTASPTKKGCC